MKYVLGINCSGFLSSACLLTKEGVHTAICEERITRVKQDQAFPRRAIEYCLLSAGIELRELSGIYVGWHPRFYLQRSDLTTREAFRERGRIGHLALNEIATLVTSEIQDVSQVLRFDNNDLQIHFVDHHKAHLSNAFFQSGYREADFLVLDGFGEVSTGFSGTISGVGMSILGSIRTPHSLGSFYSAFTDFLGFRANSDEWKVMALAALGDPARFYKQVRQLVRVNDLSLELDLSYFEHFLFFTRPYYTQKFVSVFGEPLPKGAEPTQLHCDVVAAAQRVAEEVVFELLGNLAAKGSCKKLVVGGGFFMNSVCNGKLLKSSPYDEVFVGASPDDSGVSIGCAYWAANNLGWLASVPQSRHNYFGRPYAASECKAEVIRRKIQFRQIEDPSKKAAELISQRQIIGWFQGRSEFGQRALGNRSILANPTDPRVKEELNARVKYREVFRPFAPAVLEERQDILFKELQGETSYFMEKVFPFNDSWSARLPGVTHFDGSGRLQTISKDTNPLFHKLVSNFEAVSGVPAVVNTSFNTNGMPLVETPADAINCFYDSGIDALILDDILLIK